MSGKSYQPPHTLNNSTSGPSFLESGYSSGTCSKKSSKKRRNERKQELRRREATKVAEYMKEAETLRALDGWLRRDSKEKTHIDLIEILTNSIFTATDIDKFFWNIPKEDEQKLRQLAGDQAGSNVFISAVELGVLDKLERLLFEFGDAFAEDYFINGRVPPDAETVFHVIFRQDHSPAKRLNAMEILTRFNTERLKSIIHLGTRSDPSKTVEIVLQQPQHCMVTADSALHLVVVRALQKWMGPDFKPELSFLRPQLSFFAQNIQTPEKVTNPELKDVVPQDLRLPGSAAGHALAAENSEYETKDDIRPKAGYSTPLPQKLSKIEKELLARRKSLERKTGKTYKDLKEIVTSANFSDRDIQTFFDTIPTHRWQDRIVCLGKPDGKNIFLVAAKCGNFDKFNKLVSIFENCSYVDLHRYFFQGRGNKNQTILYYAVNRDFAEDIRIKMVNLCKKILKEEIFTLSSVKGGKDNFSAFNLVNRIWTPTNRKLQAILDDGRRNPSVSILTKSRARTVSEPVLAIASVVEKNAPSLSVSVSVVDPRTGLYPPEPGKAVDDSPANRLAQVLGGVVKPDSGSAGSASSPDVAAASNSSSSYGSSDSSSSDEERDITDSFYIRKDGLCVSGSKEDLERALEEDIVEYNARVSALEDENNVLQAEIDAIQRTLGEHPQIFFTPEGQITKIFRNQDDDVVIQDSPLKITPP